MGDILRTAPNESKRYSPSHLKTPVLRNGEYDFRPDQPFLVPVNGNSPSAAHKPSGLETTIDAAGDLELAEAARAAEEAYIRKPSQNP